MKKLINQRKSARSAGENREVFPQMAQITTDEKINKSA